MSLIKNRFTLMLRNEPLVRVDIDRMECEHLGPESKYPLSLRGIARKRNLSVADMVTWVRRRMTASYRPNYEAIVNCGGFMKHNRVIEWAIISKALSLTDSYWLKYNSDESWDEVKLFSGRFDMTYARAAWTGKEEMARTSMSPEFTTQGRMLKCWTSETGGIFLNKGAATIEQINITKQEVAASKCLEWLDAGAAKYRYGKLFGSSASVCKNLATEDVSIVSLKEYIEYIAELNNLEPNSKGEYDVDIFELIPEKEHEKVYKCIIGDYIVGNIGRNFSNIGFFVDNNTGGLTEMHPTLDYSYSLLGTGGEPSMFMQDTTMKKAARIAKRKLNSGFNITEFEKMMYSAETKKTFRLLFVSEKQYLGVIERYEAFMKMK